MFRRVFNFSAVLMFHRVVLSQNSDLTVNRELEITADYFEHLLIKLIKSGFCFRPLADMKRGEPRSLYVTFDDGYLDNLEVAYPILRKYNIPFTIFVNPYYIENQVVPWWYQLEKILTTEDTICVDNRVYPLNNRRAINDVFFNVRRRIVHEGEKFEDILHRGLSRERMFLDWNDLKFMLSEGLACVGNHTYEHSSLINWDRDALDSFVLCHKNIKKNLGVDVNVFAAPYGVIPESSEFREFLVERDYAFCLSTTSGFISKRFGSDKFNVSRINVTEGKGLYELFGRKNLIRNAIYNF